VTPRPQLKSRLSRSGFRDAVAGLAAEFSQWIELSVDAFDPDPAARQLRLARVADPVTGYRYFLETYLPHYIRGEASLFHEAIFARVPAIMSASKGVRDIFVAPRGSSKSTHISLGLVLYRIVMRTARFVVEVCDVAAQAALLIEAIKAELMTNPRLRADFPEVCGKGRVWREGQIVTRTNVMVIGLGAGQKVRGLRHGPYRPDLLIFDDLENDEQVREPDQRDKLERWVYRAALKLGPADGSMHVIWVGTILHHDAVLVRACKKPGWRVTKFQAVVKFPDRMDLWELFEEAYHAEGEGAALAYYAQHEGEMNLGAVVNWPAVQPLVQLMLERAASPDAFMTEYQNSPIATGNPFGKITFWVTDRRDLVFFGAVDPSLGKHGKGRDPSAILIGGMDRLTGRMDVVEASIRRRLPDVIIADAIALQREYRCLLWFVEAVQFQEFLRTTLMQEAARQGVGISAVPVVPSADKTLRIERLQPPIAAGLIRLHPTQTTLIEQLQQWPDADHDDGPDCLDMLWQYALRYSGGGGGSITGVMAGGGGGRGQRLLGDYRL